MKSQGMSIEEMKRFQNEVLVKYEEEVGKTFGKSKMDKVRFARLGFKSLLSFCMVQDISPWCIEPIKRKDEIGWRIIFKKDNKDQTKDFFGIPAKVKKA